MKTVDVPQNADSLSAKESPDYVRTSLAAAMTMGKMRGKFYRGARLYCINLLLTYEEGCHAKCAYCGLSSSRKTGTEWEDNSFIRVDWPVFSLDEVKKALIDGSCSYVERVCVSMITLDRSREDCISVVAKIRDAIPRISVLITPTIVNQDWLRRIKEAGADKVGIAVDAATEEIFDILRGKIVRGPHKWSKYWQTVKEAIEVFGIRNVGIHLIVGLGETEAQMIETIQRAQDMGARTHLFSFFPEEGSIMENHPQPPLGSYRRVQTARYIINNVIGSFHAMSFNDKGQLIDFGINPDMFEKVLKKGEAFMTSGCSGETMENACNRPMANCTPYQAAIGHWRNFPITLEKDDIEKIREQLKDYSLTYEVADSYLDED